MGVWRYCEHCGAGQNRIDIGDLEEISYDEHEKVRCAQCNKPRGDDTPAARTVILVNGIKSRDERMDDLERKLKTLAKITRQLVKKTKLA